MGIFGTSLRWLYGALLPGTRKGREARITGCWDEGIRLYRSGRYSESQETLGKTVEIASEEGAGIEVLCEALDRLADFYRSVGNYSKSQPLYRRLLDLKAEHFGDHSPGYLVTVNDLALLHYAQGNNQESEALYQRLIPSLEEQLPENSLELAVAFENYGALLRRLKRETESASLLARAREIRQRRKHAGA